MILRKNFAITIKLTHAMNKQSKSLWRCVQRLVRRFFAPSPVSVSPEMIIVIFGDGRCAPAADEEEAQGIVLRECLHSDKPVFANFRLATPAEIAALAAPNNKLGNERA